MLRDDDVAERLYSHNTTATLKKRQEIRPPLDFGGSALLDRRGGAAAAHGAGGGRDVDVKAEVDRMYSNIMKSLEMEIREDLILPDDLDGASPPKSGRLFTTTDDLRSMNARAGAGAMSPPSSGAAGHRYPTEVDVRHLIKPLNLNQLGSTFGSGRKTTSEGVRKTQDPGPGSYYRQSSGSTMVGRSKGTPRWVKPSSHRGDTASSNGSRSARSAEPGPGVYVPPSTFMEKKPTSAKGTMGNAKTDRTKLKKESQPGPGSYDLEGRRRNTVRSPSPAGRSTGETKERQVPFGTKAPRMPTVRHDSPGPGRYNAEEALKKTKEDGPKYSMPKSEPRPKVKSNTPGPGQYLVEKADAFDRDKAIRGVIPSAGRVKEEFCGQGLEKDLPGPGAYSPTDLDVGPSFSIALPHGNADNEEQSEKKKDSGPGPGAYCPEAAHDTWKEGPQWTMGGKAKPDKAPDPTPGPADYVVPSNLPDEPQAQGPTFGTGERGLMGDEKAKKAGEEVPGPGAYDPIPVGDRLDAAAKGHGFGTEPRSTLPSRTEATPGPGAYVPEAGHGFGTDAPAVTITAKPVVNSEAEKAAKEPTPGPGYYDTLARSALEQGKIAHTIGTAPRPALVAESDTPNTVGPGAYEYNHLLEKGPEFTIGQKTHTMEEQKAAEAANLGPGSYAVTYQDTREAITIGTAERFTDKKKAEDEVPGPGAYAPTIEATTEAVSAPAVVFPTAVRAIGQSDAPTSTPATVGPGSYVDFRPTAPIGGEIGRAQRFEEPDATKASNQVPGPGAYQPYTEGSPHGPAVAFTTAPARPEDKEKEQIPGPGHYVANDQLQHPAVPAIHMGTALARPVADTEKQGAPPGPGAYQPSLDAVLPAPPSVTFSRGAHHTGEVEKTDDLGPGAYTPQYEQVLRGGAIPAYSFGSAPKLPTETISDAPGVGTYYPEITLTSDRAPSAMMLGGVKGAGDGQGGDPTIPGPGAYMPNDALTKPAPPLTSFGTGIRTDDATAKEQAGPGPGAYTPIEPQRHVPTAVFEGTGHKPLSAAGGISEETPGPGAYTPHFGADQVGISFGTAMREAMAALNGEGGGAGPGPGAYTPSLAQVTERIPAPSFGIGAKDGPPRHDQEFPGPGHYIPGSNPAIPTAPVYSFGTGIRVDQKTSAAAVPGPGAYHPEDTAATESAPAWTFPQSAPHEAGTKSTADDTPGPGAYTGNMVPPSIPGVPVFGTAQREVQSKDNGVPGPGSYAPETGHGIGNGEGAVAYSFGMAANRPPADPNKDIPGPGAYLKLDQGGALSSSGAPAVTMGMGPGHEDPAKASSVAPGPGAYAVDYAVTQENAPSYSFPRATPATAKRDDEGEGESAIPGPGTYLPLAMPSGPAVSFAQSGRVDQDAKNKQLVPGPGHYDLVDQNDAPSVSIAPPASNQSRVETVPAPGPGAYDTYIRSDAPAYSFPKTAHAGAGEDSEKTQEVAPGPGAYDLQQRAGSEAPAISFAKSTRADPADADAAKKPGPGTYDTYVPSHAPAVTIVGKPKDVEGEKAGNLPGPGHYDVVAEREGPFYSMMFNHPGKEGEKDDTRGAPGPGAYHLTSTLNDQGVSIPQAGRKDTAADAKANMPGPGEYDVTMGDRQVHEFGPMWSIPMGRPKAAESAGGDALGPGAYDLHGPSAAGGPSYSFPHSKRQGVADPTGSNTIGPGEYDLHPSQLPHQGPKYSIPKASGHGQGESDGPGGAPGPGQYYHPLIMQGGFTFQGKWKDDKSAQNQPGPGAYHMDYDPYRRDLATVIDFSKGGPVIRQGPVTVTGGAGPGPGSYIGPTQFSQGGVHMYHRFPEPYVVPTPGPADYNPTLKYVSEM